MNHDELKGTLAHRHPMLQVDRVDRLDLHERVVAVKAISGVDPCYSHMSDQAAQIGYSYPLCLVLEALGQAAGVLWLTSLKARGELSPGNLILAEMKDVQVFRRVFPGDVLTLDVRADHMKEDFSFFEARAKVRGDVVVHVGRMMAILRHSSSL